MDAREKARRAWRRGRKPQEIAEKYGISVHTIRAWIRRYWKHEPGAPSPKRGAPHGNRNAIGHVGGAPYGNKNNFKHGIYERISWETITEEERLMVDSMVFDTEYLIEDEIRLCAVRERRFLRRMAALNPSTVDSVLVRRQETTRTENGSKEIETITNTISDFDAMCGLEAELTRIQGRKTRCIDSLIRMRNARRQREADSQSGSIAIEWIEALTENGG